MFHRSITSKGRRHARFLPASRWPPAFRALPLLLATLGLARITALAEDAPKPANRDLTELSLEELVDMPVTSVSKKPEKLSQALDTRCCRLLSTAI